MGKNVPTNGREHLSAATDDILRTFPSAEIRWDTRTMPYMISVAVDGAIVRAFIEPVELAQRGEIYDAFTRRISELVTDASKPDRAN
jgi:hypothetical protein